MINITLVLHVCAVLVCILWLAYFFRVTLVEVLPVFVCMLSLILYMLAMLRHLSWIDVLAAAVLFVFLIWFIKRPVKEKKAFGKTCAENVTSASFVTAFLMLVVIAVCTLGKVVSWWDDINFWASDVKSLYYLDGFAGRYGNVSPEFGDYPPGAQVIKWWFLHLNPQEYREGLAFVGYYTMNMVFLFPLLRKLKGRNVLVMLFTAAALWMLPSIAEVYGYSGFCADLTMACIYGGFLLAVTRLGECIDGGCDRRMRLFMYGRCGLYLGVLVLVKSIGFVWALFGIVFLFLYSRKEHKSERKRQWLPIAVVAAVPVLTGASWMLFCLLMRRVTNTTATAVRYMTTDEYGLSGYTGDFARAFMKAFVGLPLHKDRTIAIDLTPLGLYLCICLFVIVFYKLRVISAKRGRMILLFTIISGAVFYAVIFVAHTTIFATETQYLEAAGMISSIERYGAPFTVGTLLFLAGIFLEGADRLWENCKENALGRFIREYGAYLCLILFVALTAGYQVGYDGLVGYRDETQAKLEERAEMLGSDERLFLDALGALGTEKSARVCYLRRGDAPRWVNNSYTAYEASPVSVVFRSVNLNDAPTDYMVQEIRASHASYFYAEETDQDAGAVFDSITEGNTFACGILYRIDDDGTGIKLTQVNAY